MAISISRTTIVLVFIVAVFLFVDGILVAGIFSSQSNLKACKNNQNTNCPVILCNGDPNHGNQAPTVDDSLTKNGTNPSYCWPYSYREVLDSSGNIVSYQCNFPYQGDTPLVGS